MAVYLSTRCILIAMTTPWINRTKRGDQTLKRKNSSIESYPTEITIKNKMYNNNNNNDFYDPAAQNVDEYLQSLDVQEIFENFDIITFTKQEEDEILNFKEDTVIEPTESIKQRPAIDRIGIHKMLSSLEIKPLVKLQSISESSYHYLNDLIKTQREITQDNVQNNELLKKQADDSYAGEMKELQEFYFRQVTRINKEKILAEQQYRKNLAELDSEKVMTNTQQNIISFMKTLTAYGNNNYIVVSENDTLENSIDHLSWIEGKFISNDVPMNTELHNALNSIYASILKSCQHRSASLFIKCNRSVPLISRTERNPWIPIPNTTFAWNTDDYFFNVDGVPYKMTNCIFWNQQLFLGYAAKKLASMQLDPTSPVGLSSTYVILDIVLYSHNYK